MTSNKAVTPQEWYEWTNGTYNSQFGKKFIRQIFRICRFWSSPKTLMQLGFTPNEVMAYDAVCKEILNGLSNENIADLFSNTRKQGEN